jgi:hypothetical protein
MPDEPEPTAWQKRATQNSSNYAKYWSPYFTELSRRTGLSLAEAMLFELVFLLNEFVGTVSTQTVEQRRAAKLQREILERQLKRLKRDEGEGDDDDGEAWKRGRKE